MGRGVRSRLSPNAGAERRQGNGESLAPAIGHLGWIAPRPRQTGHRPAQSVFRLDSCIAQRLLAPTSGNGSLSSLNGRVKEDSRRQQEEAHVEDLREAWWRRHCPPG